MLHVSVPRVSSSDDRWSRGFAANHGGHPIYIP